MYSTDVLVKMCILETKIFFYNNNSYVNWFSIKHKVYFVFGFLGYLDHSTTFIWLRSRRMCTQKWLTNMATSVDRRLIL